MSSHLTQCLHIFMVVVSAFFDDKMLYFNVVFVTFTIMKLQFCCTTSMILDWCSLCLHEKPLHLKRFIMIQYGKAQVICRHLCQEICLPYLPIINVQVFKLLKSIFNLWMDKKNCDSTSFLVQYHSLMKWDFFSCAPFIC